MSSQNDEGIILNRNFDKIDPNKDISKQELSRS